MPIPYMNIEQHNSWYVMSKRDSKKVDNSWIPEKKSRNNYIIYLGGYFDSAKIKLAKSQLLMGKQ